MSNGKTYTDYRFEGSAVQRMILGRPKWKSRATRRSEEMVAETWRHRYEQICKVLQVEATDY